MATRSERLPGLASSPRPIDLPASALAASGAPRTPGPSSHYSPSCALTAPRPLLSARPPGALQVFGGRHGSLAPAEVPRTNFDSIAFAMITTFVVAAGDAWNEVWIDTHTAVGEWSAAYFILLIVLANYILLNLVVALLISSFVNDKQDPPPSGALSTAALANETTGDDSDDDGTTSTGGGGCVPRRLRRLVADASRRDASLALMPPDHPVRRMATALVNWRWGESVVSFENVIILLILISSAELAFNSCDLDSNSALAGALARVDHIAIGCFTLEMVAKVVSLGLVFTPNAYLKSGWNRLDGFIVTASILSDSSPAFRALRVLRVLRPLRLISRFDGMRVCVTLLSRAVPLVLDVIMIFLLFLVVFAILGVQLFGGRLAHCVAAPELSTSDACAAAGHVWTTPPRGHFDNVFAASLLLFEMATLEGWTTDMFMGIDATVAGAGPVRDASPVYAHASARARSIHITSRGASAGPGRAPRWPAPGRQRPRSLHRHRAPLLRPHAAPDPCRAGLWRPSPWPGTRSTSSRGSCSAPSACSTCWSASSWQSTATCAARRRTAARSSPRSSASGRHSSSATFRWSRSLACRAPTAAGAPAATG